MASRGTAVVSDAGSHFIILDEGVDLRVGGVLGRAAHRDGPPRGERRYLRVPKSSRRVDGVESCGLNSRAGAHERMSRSHQGSNSEHTHFYRTQLSISDAAASQVQSARPAATYMSHSWRRKLFCSKSKLAC